MKDALWGGGGTLRSWPGGRGGRPRALIPGEGSGKGYELAWWTGVREAGQGLGGACKGFGCGGVGGRGTGPRDGANLAMCVVFLLFLMRKKKEKWLFLKDALWGGGGTHRSWPGGRGGRPRALIPGEGVREGLAWALTHGAGLVDGGVREAGQGLGGGARASVPGGVGGRGTGPRDGANFATCVVFMPCGVGGVPTGAGLVDGGVYQGP